MILKTIIGSYDEIRPWNSTAEMKAACLTVWFHRKCFSQVKTLSFSICLWKSLSATLYLVSSLSQSLRHLRYASFRAAGLKLPYPDPLGSTASTAANHGTVISRHVQEYVFVVFVVKYTIIKSILVRTLRLSTELEGRHVDVCARYLSRDYRKKGTITYFKESRRPS